jgi:hypothetical protein
VWEHNSLSNAKLWQSSLFLFPEMQKLFALFSQIQKLFALFSQMQKALAKLFALKKFSSTKDKLKAPKLITTTKTQCFNQTQCKIIIKLKFF